MMLFLGLSQSWACEVCERNQPKLLRGLIHGTGPEHQWDLIILVIMVLIVLATLYFSVRWLIKPGEKSTNHIKRMILNQDDYDR